MFETLEIEKTGAVTTVWMNRPDVHNAFNALLIAELTQAFQEVTLDAGTRVMVLAGRGKSFSAGADLTWMRAQGEASFEENLAGARQLGVMLRILSGLPKPSIARVHGAALGGGVGLAAACDICVASPEASFATTEVKLGLIPSAISPYVVRAIGRRQAHRYFLTAERFDAARAAEIGLVHKVAQAERIDEEIDGIIAALFSGGPKAQAASKELLSVVDGRPLDDHVVEETARRIAEIRATPEAKEGLAAFLAKRPAPWISKA